MTRTACCAALIAASLAVHTELVAAPALTSRLVASGLTSPVFVTHAPGDTSRVFVLERRGRVRIIKDGSLLPTPYLNIWTLVSESGEGGMLGLAFHPNYASNGFFYVRYNDTSGRTTIARYRVSPNPDLAATTSAQIVLRISQPSILHSGGAIEFGPDGYLYIAQGDGTSADSAQDLTDNLMGKILRIDVNGDDFPADPLRNYAIPPTNPFVGTVGDDEIWAYGLRNPYRISFDRQTGDLWMPDVGAASWEEVNVHPAGLGGGVNYGWPCMEGLQCGVGIGCLCPSMAYRPPIWAYSHSTGCAIIGGRVYRGCAIPEFAGAYFCADFCSGRIWSLRYTGQSITDFQQHQAALDPPGPASISAITAIGEDAYGELYICDMDGEIYQIISRDAPDQDGDGLPDACEEFSPADLDLDGAVDGDDLAILLGHWGRCAACPADLNQDGNVNGIDLAMLLGSWGGTPVPSS